MTEKNHAAPRLPDNNFKEIGNNRKIRFLIYLSEVFCVRLGWVSGQIGFFYSRTHQCFLSGGQLLEINLQIGISLRNLALKNLKVKYYS